MVVASIGTKQQLKCGSFTSKYFNWWIMGLNGDGAQNPEGHPGGGVGSWRDPGHERDSAAWRAVMQPLTY